MTPDVPVRAPEIQLKMMALQLRTDSPSLLFVTTPDSEAETSLVNELRTWLGQGVTIVEATLSPEPIEHLSISRYLTALPKSSGQAVLFVFGLDDLSEPSRTIAINAMNKGRDQLRWSDYSVVVWVRSGTPPEIGNRAPDFYSWRSDVFDFEIPKDDAERQKYLSRLRLFAPISLNELRQRYCEYVIQTYRWLDFRGLLQVRNVVRLLLEGVFVPPKLIVPDVWRKDDQLFRGQDFLKTDSEESPNPPVPVENAVSLKDVLRLQPRFVVLGDPGSGKSTLLRFLALVFAQGREHVQKVFGLDEARLPILVPLSLFAEKRKTQPEYQLVDFFPQYFKEQTLPDFSALFQDALQNGQVIVLLDGLDKMLAPSERADCVQAITEFSRIYPTAQIIVTNRVAGYVFDMSSASFETFTLAPFDRDDLKRFTVAWSQALEVIGGIEHVLGPGAAIGGIIGHMSADAATQRRVELRAKNLFSAITEHPGVKQLATNPLLLTLLALIYHQGTRLLNNQIELYRLCIEVLTETWNLARSLTGSPIDLYLGERRLTEQFVVRMLAPVAYWMHQHKPGGVIDRQELETLIARNFEEEGKSKGESLVLARDIVRVVQEQPGLLLERAPDQFSFNHLSFQEFFAALAISRKTETEIFNFVCQFVQNPRYFEVLKFLVSILPFPEQEVILKYIEENNLYLLNQCLRAGGDEISNASGGVEPIDEFRDLHRFRESYLRIINTHFRSVKGIFKPWNVLGDAYAEVQGVQISEFEAVLYGAIVGKTPIASMYYSWVPVEQSLKPTQFVIHKTPKELNEMREIGQLFYFEMCNVECSSPLWPHKKALNDIKKNLSEGLASRDFYMAEDHHLATEYLYHYFGSIKETVENLLKILDSYKRDNEFFFPEGDVDESSAKAYFFLLRFQQEGLHPLEFLLPQRDRDLADLAPGEPRNSWNLWTDKQVCLRVKHLYDAYQKSYRWMVEHAFPTLKDHLAFYRLGPVQFNIQVCIKRKALEHFKGLLSGGSVSIEWKPVATMAEASTSVELIQEEQLEKESDIRTTFSRLRTQLQAQGRNPDWISKGFWGRHFAIIDTVLEDNLLHKMVYEQLKNDLSKILGDF